MSKLFSSKSMTLAGLALIATLLASQLFLPLQRAGAASTVNVSGATTHQVIDGFGASDAFHTGAYMRGDGSGLTAAQSQQIIQLLFSTTNGAGLTIIRHEVGSSTAMVTGVPAGGDGDNLASIEPNNPGGPNATPTYVWNTADPDSGQIWFTQQAQSYYPNVKLIADAWSSPAYMKNNGTLINGGFLCGAVGAPTCASGDWRQHYANYLTQYVKFYKDAGITIDDIGFTNEPELSPSYTGMNWDATNVVGNRGTVNAAMPQSIDFIKNYLGPSLAAAGLTTKVLCCDATSWANTATYTSGIMADATASGYIGLITGHGYYSSPNGVITTPITAAGSKHVWETETSTFDTFSTAWDDGTDASGLQWAQNLWNGLVNANVNGFLYWWFAELNANNSDNEAFINMNAGNYSVSSRLWAFANYSRFIRPGATRIDATTTNSNLKVSAFKNTDGSFAIVVLNIATASEPVSFSLTGGNYGNIATPYLTNGTNNTAAQAGLSVSGGTFSATVPARSLVTYSIPDGGPTPTPCAACSPTPTRTKTLTPTVTNTPAPGLNIQINKGTGTDNTQETTFNVAVKNTGSAALSNISTRIYFDTDGSNAASGYVLEKYYDQSGVATISGPTLACGSTYYYTVNYGTASLAAGGLWQFQTALHLSSWASTYDGSNDWYHTGYAVGALPASYTNTNYVPGYLNAALTWGNTPNCGGATATPTQTVGASNTPVSPTATRTPTPTCACFTNTPTRTVPPESPTATRTPTQPVAASNTPVSPTATRTSTSVPPTATPGGSDPCTSPTVITGGGSFAISTSATCFKYVNAANKWGGMFTVMNGSSSAANTLKWYGGRSETVTSCINDNQTLNGNGAQLNNFTIAKDSTGAMYLTVTGSAANTISISIQNWQNGSGCSATPTPHP